MQLLSMIQSLTLIHYGVHYVHNIYKKKSSLKLSFPHYLELFSKNRCSKRCSFLTCKGYYHRMACQIAVILKIYLYAITQKKPIGAHRPTFKPETFAFFAFYNHIFVQRNFYKLVKTTLTLFLKFQVPMPMLCFLCFLILVGYPQILLS